MSDIWGAVQPLPSQSTVCKLLSSARMLSCGVGPHGVERATV